MADAIVAGVTQVKEQSTVKQDKASKVVKAAEAEVSPKNKDERGVKLDSHEAFRKDN